MSKIVTIKLTRAGQTAGPFDISDQLGNIIASNVAADVLIAGISYSVDDSVSMVTVTSIGECTFSKSKLIGEVTPSQVRSVGYTTVDSACLWKHLVMNMWNNFYGNICPYVIEYPFFSMNTEILQNVKDYTKAYHYNSDGTGVFSYTDKIETDDHYFNKAIVYNNQQSSGILKLVPKPKNNLLAYMEYPKYESDSKVITYTKSDNMYNYNNIYNIVKDKTQQLWITSCESLSIDREINQANMNYTHRAFHKDPLRAKDIKIRHILDIGLTFI